MEADAVADIQSPPPSSELEALHSAALLVRVDGLDWLRLRGADRIDFLHGQVSNDVRGLAVGGNTRALLLNHRGHALAETRILRSEEELLVAVEGDAVGIVEDSLRRHIIFDQVELERPSEPLVPFTLTGANAEGVLADAGLTVPAEEGIFVRTSLSDHPVTLLRSRRTEFVGFELYLPEEAVESATAALQGAGAVLGSWATLTLARVCAGIASAAGEGGEGVLPQEAGLEPLVSYRKGCYLGQEIMARIEARGKLRRELGALVLEEAPRDGERKVVRDSRPVGLLGTVARHPDLGFVALAVLRSDLSEADSLEVGGIPARRVGLPLSTTSARGDSPAAGA